LKSSDREQSYNQLRPGASVIDVARIQEYTAALVHVAPDLIVANATPVIAARKRATQSIPIVFVVVNDPVAQGIVSSDSGAIEVAPKVLLHCNNLGTTPSNRGLYQWGRRICGCGGAGFVDVIFPRGASSEMHC
jgi:ABC transporter substrate binding protein